MEKTYNVHGEEVKIRECSVYYTAADETVDSVMIHWEKEQFHDGDRVTACDRLPIDDEEATNIIDNNFLATFIINEENEIIAE